MTDQTYRMAVDIGGTFTDLVALGGDGLELTKAPTTPDDFADGVLNSIDKSAFDTSSVNQFIHGTTVVINAITEREGVDTALITTEGFRDVLDITRANRPDMYNFQYDKPEPFVKRRNRWEVEERVDADGNVLTELSEDDVLEAISEIQSEGFDSIAVAYINSHAYPGHERRTKEVIKEEYPDAFVTVSHDLTKEYREYERTNTAVLNSYVRPIIDRYLTTLEGELESVGITGRKYAMRSNAGTARFHEAKKKPVELAESGPVGGVYGAAQLGEHIGESNVISFDMGGTTAKTSLIENGEVTIDTEYWLESSANEEGYPLKIPVVDIVEIGAGGGSIAWIDQGGSLKVGPKSAGAKPGPACYGLGGTEPTVTDANLLAGRLNPDYFLGGEMELDEPAAREALEPIADRFDMSPAEAAQGVIQIVNSNMGNALKQVSIRRGYDPRDFILVASGGAGGLHATALGQELGVRKIVIPRAPGQFSARGMLRSDLRRDYIQTSVMDFDPSTTEDIRSLFEEMEQRARKAFRAEDFDPDNVSMERSVDLRYMGQEHTVNTRVSPSSGGNLATASEIGEDTLEASIERFHQGHEQTYNFRLDDPVEVVNLRLTATYEVDKPTLDRVQRDSSVRKATKGTRLIDFGNDGQQEATIFERDRLPTDARIEGPAVVEEPACTTLVQPEQTLTLDEFGNLHIE